MKTIYKPGSTIPLGNLIRAYILNWYTYCTDDRLHQSSEQLRAWRATERLIRFTLNQTAVRIPTDSHLADAEIEA